MFQAGDEQKWKKEFGVFDRKREDEHGQNTVTMADRMRNEVEAWLYTSSEALAVSEFNLE